MQTTKSTQIENQTIQNQLCKVGLYFLSRRSFLAYALFHFAPQLLTIYNSFLKTTGRV